MDPDPLLVKLCGVETPDKPESLMGETSPGLAPFRAECTELTEAVDPTEASEGSAAEA